MSIRFPSCAVAALALVAWSTDVRAEGELNLLTWEGYADPSFVEAFEQESGCKVTATYVGSNDDFVPKLAAGGGVYDLISPSIDTAPVTVAAGFVDPIDPAQVPALADVYPLFRDHAGLNSDG